VDGLYLNLRMYNSAGKIRGYYERKKTWLIDWYPSYLPELPRRCSYPQTNQKRRRGLKRDRAFLIFNQLGTPLYVVLLKVSGILAINVMYPKNNGGN